MFWKNLSGFLSSKGFNSNPYDSCVMNKIVNGKQCTILWHVDDIKISHVEEQVLDHVYERLNKRYGKHTPLSITCGKTHDYLGMTLDYCLDGKLIIRMESYIQSLLEYLPGGFEGIASTPAADYLFTVDDSAERLLDTEYGELFHSTTAKLLFLGKRGRPDIQTAVALLCTRMTHPDVDDIK